MMRLPVVVLLPDSGQGLLPAQDSGMMPGPCWGFLPDSGQGLLPGLESVMLPAPDSGMRHELHSELLPERGLGAKWSKAGAESSYLQMWNLEMTGAPSGAPW